MRENFKEQFELYSIKSTFKQKRFGWVQHFLLNCVNDNFKNQSLIDVQLRQVLHNFREINGIIKSNTNYLKNSGKYSPSW